MPKRAVENNVPVVPLFVLSLLTPRPLIVTVAFIVNDTESLIAREDAAANDKVCRTDSS